jgi:hypothetical protein
MEIPLARASTADESFYAGAETRVAHREKRSSNMRQSERNTVQRHCSIDRTMLSANGNIPLHRLQNGAPRGGTSR